MNKNHNNSIIVAYMKWHYGSGLVDFLNVYKNFSKFLIHFFSFKLLLKTIFQPWHRLKEKYTNVLDIENFLSSLLINVILRSVGFFTKIFVMIFGVIIYIIFNLLAVVLFILWLFMPIFLLSLFVLTITFILI